MQFHFRATDDPPPSIELVREMVGVVPLAGDRSRGMPGPQGVAHGGIYGGQLVALALSACAHTVPPGSIPDFLTVNLIRSARLGEPIDFEVVRVRDGRSMQHRTVQGFQGDELVVHALVVSAMPGAGTDWQREAPPAVPPPDLEAAGVTTWGMAFGRGVFHTVRPVGEDDPDAPLHPIWVRSVLDVADPWLAAAVRAYWSDFGLNSHAQQAHVAAGGEAVGSVSATHAMWFHRSVPLDQWHLFVSDADSVAGNQGFVTGSIHDADGRLVASIQQGVFIRNPAP